MYDKHQIFLTFTAMVNIIVLISAGVFCFTNLNDLDHKVTYSSLGIFLISSFIFFSLIMLILHDRNPTYMKMLIVSYVLLMISLSIFLFFSFYKQDITSEFDTTNKLIFGVIVAAVMISTIMFLVSEYLITGRENHLSSKENIEITDLSNFKNGKIIDLDQHYDENMIKEHNEITFVREKNLRDIIDIPNVITIPTKIYPCNISVLQNCYFKDSDLFTKNGKFSTKTFRGSGYASRFRNKPLKDIYDDVFRKILTDAANGGTVAFPKENLGLDLEKKAPKIFKYINQYKKYLILLSKIYGDELPAHLNQHQILIPETLHRLDPDLDKIEEENDYQIKKSLASMFAREKKLDVCQYIMGHLKDDRGKRDKKYDKNLVARMRTLVSDLDCHDENVEQLSEILASNYTTIQEAKIKVKELKEEFESK